MVYLCKQEEEFSCGLNKRQLLLLLLFHFLLLSLDPLLALHHLVREERKGGPGFHLSKSHGKIGKGWFMNRCPIGINSLVNDNIFTQHPLISVYIPEYEQPLCQKSHRLQSQHTQRDPQQSPKLVFFRPMTNIVVSRCEVYLRFPMR